MGRITLDQVTKSFGDVNVIPPLDLTIDDGMLSVIVEGETDVRLVPAKECYAVR